MNKEVYDDEFEDYIGELRRAYENNPNVVMRETRSAVRRIRKADVEVEKKSVLGDIDVDIFSQCILIICIALLGFFNIMQMPIYLFGVVFFVAGHFVGLKVKYFGLIFLFSHSVTGMCIMEGALLGKVFGDPRLLDNSTGIYIYLGINLVLLIVATLFVILYNLSDNLKEKSHSQIIPMLIYFIAFLMSGILSHFFESIYKCFI